VSTEDRAFGLHLALRLGDESAAPPLADLLLPAKANSPFPILGSVFVLWPDPPGEAWAKAVEEAWRRNGREEWMVERWLAARGVPDALERIRKHGRPFRMHDANPEDPGAALLARRGEAAALGRLLERAIGGPLPPATERGFLAGLDPAWRLRLLAAARRQSLQPSSGVLRLAALAGLPEAVPLYRSAVCGGANRADGGDLGDVVTVPCLEALAKLGVRDAIPEIRLHLRGRPRFAAAAALALARLGDRESLPSILALAEQPDEIANEEWDVDRPRPDGPSRRVWDAALEALEILTGEKPRGTSTLERRAWWRDWNAARRDR
jgi:hypothetical protein